MAVFADLPYELRQQVFQDYFATVLSEDANVEIVDLGLLYASAQIQREAAQAAIPAVHNCINNLQARCADAECARDLIVNEDTTRHQIYQYVVASGRPSDEDTEIWLQKLRKSREQATKCEEFVERLKRKRLGLMARVVALERMAASQAETVIAR